MKCERGGDMMPRVFQVREVECDARDSADLNGEGKRWGDSSWLAVIGNNQQRLEHHRCVCS